MCPKRKQEIQTEASPERAVQLPEAIAFNADDNDYLPDGVITAWVSGSIGPLEGTVMIDRNPAIPSITLPSNDEDN